MSESRSRQNSPEFAQKYPYEFFRSSREREELYHFSKVIVEYIRNEKINDVILLDRSARPAYVGIREYFAVLYPDEQQPRIYFVNPKGFKSIENLSPDELESIFNEFEGDPKDDPKNIRHEEDVRLEFQKTYHRLIADKEKPVLIFDTCLHTGHSVKSVKEMMGKVGFRDLRVGAVNPSDQESVIETDFFLTEDPIKKGCSPYDQDCMIEKTFDHVHSTPSSDPEKKAMGRRLRTEIKHLMQEQIKKEQSH